MKNRQNLLLALAIGVAVLFAGDKLLYGPLLKLWGERSTRIADLRKKVSDGEKLRLREQAIQNRWNYMHDNILPDNPSIAEQKILQAFDIWAQVSRVSITSIAPQWKRDSEDHLSLECRVDAFGNLQTVTRFLYEIEHDPMALKMELVEIGARDNEGQQIGLGLQINGLVLNPQAQ